MTVDSAKKGSVSEKESADAITDDKEKLLGLTIDGNKLSVKPGTTILDAAGVLGIEIPTMCHNQEVEHFTSCMICLVKNKNNGRLYPACSMAVQEGMNIITIDEEIKEARQTGLELLLSDHVGDCEAPCTMACPAHMDIPEMNRLLSEGKFNEALQVVKKNIALPSILGHICPAPCEGACRRKPIDGAVSICLLKQFAGDIGMIQEEPAPLNGHKVAIIGSGPAGLSAAYYLQLKGIQVAVFDKATRPGGMLRSDMNREKLPVEILDREIEVIGDLGVKFYMGIAVDSKKFEELKQEFDAVIIASGVITEEQRNWGIGSNDKGFIADEHSYQTNSDKVFAIGNSLKSSKLAIRSLAQGKEVSVSVMQLLKGDKPKGEQLRFNSKFGKLIIPEYAQYLMESVKRQRNVPVDGLLPGFTAEEAMLEAKRCMHCDCRKKQDCKLRDYSDRYSAIQRRFSYEERKPVRKQFHDTIVYEPEKCIKCGICVRLTAKYQEKYGFTYIGRGFEVEIGVPFNESIDEGLKIIAEKVADSCPTGALGRK